jgi:hypothetical protein
MIEAAQDNGRVWKMSMMAIAVVNTVATMWFIVRIGFGVLDIGSETNAAALILTLGIPLAGILGGWMMALHKTTRVFEYGFALFIANVLITGTYFLFIAISVLSQL